MAKLTWIKVGVAAGGIALVMLLSRLHAPEAASVAEIVAALLVALGVGAHGAAIGAALQALGLPPTLAKAAQAIADDAGGGQAGAISGLEGEKKSGVGDAKP